jgi:septal ring factor EnvC (AmiA/AmiB activator)
MYNLNKMRAHIAQLEQRKAKIQFYEQQVNASLPVDTNHINSDGQRRLREITASLTRIQNQIDQYNDKLLKFTPPDTP